MGIRTRTCVRHILRDGGFVPVTVYIDKNHSSSATRIRVDSYFPVQVKPNSFVFEPGSEFTIPKDQILDLQFGRDNQPILLELHPGISSFEYRGEIYKCRILKGLPIQRTKYKVILLERVTLLLFSRGPASVVRVKKKRFITTCLCEGKCKCNPISMKEE